MRFVTSLLLALVLLLPCLVRAQAASLMGDTWKLLPPSAASTVNATSLAWNQKDGAASLFVAVGNGASWTGSVAAGQPAGNIIWTFHPMLDFPAAQVVWSGTQFIAAGTGLWTSDDGVAWTIKAVNIATSPGDSNLIVVLSRISVLVYDAPRQQMKLSFSTDQGLTWGPFNDLPGHRIAMTSIASTPGSPPYDYLAVGKAGHAMHSLSGESWWTSSAALAAGENFTFVIWSQQFGRFIALTDKGGIWFYDGQIWSRGTVWKAGTTTSWVKSTTSKASRALRSVARSNNEFIATGDGGIILKSFNGIDWREFAPYAVGGSGTSQNLDSILFTGQAANPILAVAGGGGTFLSSDGPLDPPLPTITFQSSTTAFSEQGGAATITATLHDAILPAPLTVPLLFAGTDAAKPRFKSSATSLVFAAGQTSKAFTLQGVDDQMVQGDQNLTITTKGAVADLYAVPAIVTVIDNEPLIRVNFDTTQSIIQESGSAGANFATLTLRLTAPAAGDVVVPLKFVASPSMKYTRPASSSVTIKAGSTTASFTIGATNDKRLDAYDDISIYLQQPARWAALGTRWYHRLTITEDDFPPSSAGPQTSTRLVAVRGPAVLSAPVRAGRIDGVTASWTGQWLKNGAAIAGHPAETHPGDTTCYYPFNQVTLADAGKYTLKSANLAGYTLTDIQLGIVDTMPQTATVKMGGTVTLKAAVAGTGLSYQWSRNSYLLPGETNSTLVVKNVSTSNDSYVCRVSGAQTYLECGTITLLISSSLPQVVSQPLPPAGVGRQYAVSLHAFPEASLWTITGLPPGLTYNSTTGAIQGVPARPGTFTIIMTAANAIGKSRPVRTTLVVAPLPAACIGTFTAVEESDAVLNGSLGGRVDLVTTSTGSFTGKVTDKDGSVPFKGSLGGTSDGQPTVLVAVDNRTLSLNLDLTSGSLQGALILMDQSGYVSQAASVSGWRKAAATSARAGGYTFVFTSDTNAGFGYGMFTVAASGSLTLTGRTSDAAVYTVSSFTASDGHIGIYAPSSGSSLFGRVQIQDPSPGHASNAIIGTLEWARSAAIHFSSQVNGGRYTPPVSGKIVMDLVPKSNNLVIAFTGADVASWAVNANAIFTVLANSKVIPPPINPAEEQLVINAKTGEFQGILTLVSGDTGVVRTALFQGVLIRPGGTPFMVGRGAFNLPAVPPATGMLTGTVELSPN